MEICLPATSSVSFRIFHNHQPPTHSLPIPPISPPCQGNGNIRALFKSTRQTSKSHKGSLHALLGGVPPFDLIKFPSSDRIEWTTRLGDGKGLVWKVGFASCVRGWGGGEGREVHTWCSRLVIFLCALVGDKDGLLCCAVLRSEEVSESKFLEGAGGEARSAVPRRDM